LVALPNEAMILSWLFMIKFSAFREIARGGDEKARRVEPLALWDLIPTTSWS
jgi:hypothetical protein